MWLPQCSLCYLFLKTHWWIAQQVIIIWCSVNILGELWHMEALIYLWMELWKSCGLTQMFLEVSGCFFLPLLKLDPLFLGELTVLSVARTTIWSVCSELKRKVECGQLNPSHVPLWVGWISFRNVWRHNVILNVYGYFIWAQSLRLCSWRKEALYYHFSNSRQNVIKWTSKPYFLPYKTENWLVKTWWKCATNGIWVGYL